MRMRTARTMQHHAAYVTPGVVLVFALARAWRSEISHNALLAGVTFLVGASLLGVALYRRSIGKEAVFVTARFEAEPDYDPEEPVDIVSPDSVLLFGAGGFVVAAGTLALF
jgi:hypothetical protein